MSWGLWEWDLRCGGGVLVYRLVGGDRDRDRDRFRASKWVWVRVG